jgi:hypothetical protein
LIHYPHQSPIMVTLSFILVTNVFFLILIVRHAIITLPKIVSWGVVFSFLRVNFVYVHPYA